MSTFFYKACEEAGLPVPSKYDNKGKTIKLEDLPIYINNNNNDKIENAIVLIYDIFGWMENNKNVFRICDNLALNNFVAVMPDFFS